MTAATITADLIDEDAFFVTDEMYVEIQQATRSCGFATHAVIYPDSNAAAGWDFEVVSGARSADRLAAKIGPDAVTLDL